MSRQITDLSAAGANLFHAVVELQRLRASSERKFQRWFFETRTEQERAQERHGQMEAALRRERQMHADAAKNAAKWEKDKLLADKMVAEMRRELLISKEEARRAWEELGRREQEERERTASLRDGHPTLVGGVEVVPMMRGGVSRNTSVNRPQTREGAYAGSSGQEASETVEDDRYATYRQTQRTAGGADPFTETAHQREAEAQALYNQGSARTGESSRSAMQFASTAAASSSIPAPSSGYTDFSASSSQPATTRTAAPFYQHEGTSLQPQEQQTLSEAGTGSYVPSEPGTYSDIEYEIDAHGEIRRDSQGKAIPYRVPEGAHTEPSIESDDGYDHDSHGAGQYHHHGAAGASAAQGQGLMYNLMTPDYSGEAYGRWETHHHPTRLSDVQEEDERSRTSPSRASNNSRR
jgi:hypothetical protein